MNRVSPPFEMGRVSRITNRVKLEANQIARIVLINLVDQALVSPSYPIGIYTLKAYMKNNYGDRCKVEVMDNQRDTLNSIVTSVLEMRPHIIGLSVKTENKKVLDQFLRALNANMPEDYKPLLVVGRQVPTFAYQELLRQHPNIVCVRGEGELALAGLLEYVEGKKTLNEVSNIAYFDNGHIIINEPRKVINGFEEIGTIDYADAAWYTANGGDFWIETSRGCPWHQCFHCSIQEFWGVQRRRQKTVESLIEELKQVQALGIRNFPFSDEEFFGPGKEGVERARQIALGIIENKIDITFHLDLRADAIFNPNHQELRIETLRSLKRAGLKRVFMGVETGSPSQMKRINKGITIETAEGAIRICKEIGLDMAIGWIIIDPLTERKEILESIDFIRRNDILRNLSSPLNRLRIYRGMPYLRLIEEEEQQSNKKLISEEMDLNTLTFKVIDYKHPEVKAIADMIAKYADGEYDLYNAIKWFERFFHGNSIDEYGYILQTLEKAKEYQVDFAYSLASLSKEELLGAQVPNRLLQQAIEKRDNMIRGLRENILSRNHGEKCEQILLQIDKYLARMISSVGRAFI